MRIMIIGDQRHRAGAGRALSIPGRAGRHLQRLDLRIVERYPAIQSVPAGHCRQERAGSRHRRFFRRRIGSADCERWPLLQYAQYPVRSHDRIADAVNQCERSEPSLRAGVREDVAA